MSPGPEKTTKEVSSCLVPVLSFLPELPGTESLQEQVFCSHSTL